MPNTPVSHIHSTAPGPPARMAVPTPTMLPVPMVADSAVVSAPNWLMSPGASGSLVTDSLMAVGILRWMKRVRKVRNRWDPNSMMIIGGPHTKASMLLMALMITSIVVSLSRGTDRFAKGGVSKGFRRGEGGAALPCRRATGVRTPAEAFSPAPLYSAKVSRL